MELYLYTPYMPSSSGQEKLYLFNLIFVNWRGKGKIPNF